MRTFFATILGTVLATLALEALFQFLPVDSGLRLQPTTADMPFTRALSREPYVYSHGWAMTNARRGNVNQEGFNNSPDFADHAKVLIIGDSYIESFMLAYSDTVQGHLSQQLNGDVYAAAASGNGLADSLVLARYYAPRIHPRNIVVFVRDSDVSDILLPPDRGHSGFRVDGDAVELTHTPYSESQSKQPVLRSALARYIYFNLKARVLLAPASGSNGNQSHSGAEQAGRNRALTCYFEQLQLLSREVGTHIIFLVDGARKGIYAGDGSKTWVGDDREYFITQARQARFTVADMQPVFAQHWAALHERMDFLPNDGHWNSVAHRLAAQQVAPLLAH
jgi:hypothetical protein